LTYKTAYLLIALYVFTLSLIPLAGSLIALREWVGFDTGAYYYRNEHLEVRVTGLPEGLGKPRIYVYLPNSSYRPVLLIDVDDRESLVEGFSFFYDSREVKISSWNDTLTIVYVFDDFNVSKSIVASNDSVKLVFESTRSSQFYIVFKGKNYTTVNGVDLSSIHGRSLELRNVSKLEFTFTSKIAGRGGGFLEFTSPVDVEVKEDVEGVTTIAVSFRGEKLEVEVRGYTEPVRISSVTHTISSLLNHRVTQILLPIAAIASLALGWLIWRRL